MQQTANFTKAIPQTTKATIATLDSAKVSPAIRAITAVPTRPLLTFVPTVTPMIVIKPDQDKAYYDGVIVLARFYELFGHGLFAEAYQLFSTSTPHLGSVDNYVNNSKLLQVKKYQLMSAQPYFQWAKLNGYSYDGDKESKKVFWLKVYVEGEKGGVGALPNGEHSLFATVIWENGEWKILFN